jgi:uncharacterized membrane protein
MTRVSRDDSGQITTAVVVVGIVIVVWLGLVVAKFGQAIDEKSHFQTAADAAALAGAQQIVKEIPGLVRTSIGGSGLGHFLSDGCSGQGLEAARGFAVTAGAEVKQYCYDSRNDTVLVAVEGKADSVVTGSPAKTTATATAQVGLILGDCQLPVTPGPTGTPTTPPPSDILCGNLPIRMGPGPTGGDIVDMTDSEILGLFNPRLKT